MKTVTIEATLAASVDTVWAVISDVSRCDWVPAVDSIELDGDVRKFTMAGIGEVHERILLVDEVAHRFQYSAIKTPSMVQHHLATMELSGEGDSCRLVWTSEIEPDEFADAIRQGMDVSLKGLEAVLAT